MKVLLVTEASSAGCGRHVMDLAQGLLRRGHEAHLVYSERRIDSVFRSDLESLPELRSASIDMRRAPHPSDLVALRKLMSYAHRNGPFDVVHAQSSKAGALARLPLSRLGRRVFYTPHCIYTMNPRASKSAFQLVRAIELGLARASDKIIAVSPDEKEHLVDIGFPSSKVMFIPNGVDPWEMPERTAQRSKLGIPEAPTVGFIGRFDEQKNPLLMVETFALARREMPELRLAMVGDGVLRGPAEARARELGVETSIHWLGFQRAKDVLTTFDLLALTSRYEGLPYVLLEALVAGVPVVSTPVGGVDLLVGNSRCGRITPNGTAAELAESIVELLGDEGVHRQAIAAAKLRGAHYSIDAMVERTFEAYCSTVGYREPVRA